MWLLFALIIVIQVLAQRWYREGVQSSVDFKHHYLKAYHEQIFGRLSTSRVDFQDVLK